MATLTFIGLANYKPSINNLVNIIFTSNESDKTTYQYLFSASERTANPTDWINIPTLTNVKIPANTEISAQLQISAGIITTINNIYTLYIREYNGTVTSNNIIWQTSTTNPGYDPTTTTVPSINLDEITTTTYLNNLVLYSTTIGGSKNNSDFEPSPFTVNPYITSNIIYTSVAATIKSMPEYTSNIPLFIMSKSTIILQCNLNTTSTGSINIVGTGDDNSSGNGGDGILIDVIISITGNVTLHGTGGTGTGTYGGVGIFIETGGVITNSGAGTFELHGTGGTGMYGGYGNFIYK